MTRSLYFGKKERKKERKTKKKSNNTESRKRNGIG